MKFSFFMMPIHHPSESPALTFQRDIGLIRLADELGFDEFFIGEHHSGGWETMPVPEMTLAMAAAHAKRIRLGTSVVSLPYHHPFQVAERIVFLDHLTQGRAILGVGPSNIYSDRKMYGIPVEQLYEMTAESAEVIVRLLESTAVGENARQAAYAVGLLADAPGYDVRSLLQKFMIASGTPPRDVRQKR